MICKDWKESIKIDDITYSADYLERKKDADLLTKVLKRRYKALSSKSNQSAYVINVNAEWGAGKTFFVKRWAEDLKHTHPVVYIDAWSNDFMDSPIITVLAEIKEQLEQTIDSRHLSSKTKASFKKIGVTVLPKILAALVKRYGGFDIEELIENSNNCEAEPEKSSGKLDLSAAAEVMATQAFHEYSQYKNGVVELKSTIKKLIEHCILHPKKGMHSLKIDYPAFIFIDELDRCRPTYAVEMLEAIKHLFNIEGLVIVVSTHTEELQHTIKALYGINFNADDYLRRFFDTKYNLQVKLSKELLRANCDLSTLDPAVLAESGVILFPIVQGKNESRYDYENRVLEVLTGIASWLELSPRSAIQFAERCLVCIELLEKQKTYDLILIAILVGFYMFRLSDYKIIAESLSSSAFYIDHQRYKNLFEDLVDKGETIERANFQSIKQQLNTFLQNELYPQNYYGLELSKKNQSIQMLESMFYNLDSEHDNLSVYNHLQYLIDVLNSEISPDKEPSKEVYQLFDFDNCQPASIGQLIKVLMLFFGLNKTSLDEYFKLVELSSRFDD